ncbi:Dephospho-CoA kinase [uncultured Candidatus Thioglobus sp.]|nr:Dephospho-CoA kinase [uncultured Candidatus Thioglobus sp.]
MRVLKIALTGGIACGKSQLGDFFAKFGADVIKLDDISKQVTMPKTKGLKALVAVFGAKILNQDNSLNRSELRNILLETQENRSIIEEILHPIILDKMQKMIEKVEKPLVIVEVPLLIEKKLDYLFDRAIIVTCSEKEQLKRLKKRKNINENTAKMLISAQVSQQQRLALSSIMPTDIVNNDSNMANLEIQAEKLYQTLKNQST